MHLSFLLFFTIFHLCIYSFSKQITKTDFYLKEQIAVYIPVWLNLSYSANDLRHTFFFQIFSAILSFSSVYSVTFLACNLWINNLQYKPETNNCSSVLKSNNYVSFLPKTSTWHFASSAFLGRFGQTTPPLVDFLKDILRRYPEGGQILKVQCNNIF